MKRSQSHQPLVDAIALLRAQLKMSFSLAVSLIVVVYVDEMDIYLVEVHPVQALNGKCKAGKF